MALNSKDLHKHALPVVLVLAVAIIGLAAAAPSDLRAAGRALVSKVVRITPTPNGISQVDLQAPQDRSPTMLGENAAAGQAAELQFSLH